MLKKRRGRTGFIFHPLGLKLKESGSQTPAAVPPRIHKLPPLMKTIHSVLIVAFLLSAAPASFAKGKKDQRTSGTYGVAKFDVNENGILDPDEIAALRSAFAAGDTALQPLDVNNDGKLDDAEIAAIKLPAPEKKKKKKKNAE